MHRTLNFRPLLITALLASAALPAAFAQGSFELVTGKPFDSAIPKDFYLEGNAIPTQKRNAVLVHVPSGERAVFALIDTAGYSAEIISKYVGMIITEGGLSVCGRKLAVGSYGFGLTRPASGATGPGTFFVYDQGGAKITECAATRDANLKQPTPLKVVVNPDHSARLYYGRLGIDLK